MPIPVTAWLSNQVPGAKFLNLALATSDGTGDHPTGTAFLAARPILLEAYTTAATLTTTPAGTQSVLSTSGNTTSCTVNYDTAGLYGKSSDLPGFGYYQFTAAVPGSAGDGKNAGGWMLLGHLPAIKAGSTQTGVEAGWQQVGGSFTAGSRQATSATYDSAPFVLDLINVGTVAWQPAVSVSDSASANATTVVNVTDPSGETCRMFAVWAAVSATTSGLAQFTTGGVSGWTCPAGVTQVTVAAIAAGSGGGAGNATTGGEEFGGGGGGAGEWAMGTVAVTPGNVYTVTVGAGGAGGSAPGGNGAAGGDSFFSGDTTTITAHAGGAGQGATTTGDGAGGAGGTGSTAPSRYDGGAGNAGTTASSGGGGGSSASSSGPGVTATDGTGAPAPQGGGPGGDGGKVTITVVQSGRLSNTNSKTLTAKFGSPVQAGNAIIACVDAQGSGNQNNPTVALSDGTALTSTTSTSLGNGTVVGQFGVYGVFGVTGGQTGLKLTSQATGDLVNLIQWWEVSGLGPSPNTDASNSATGTNLTYDVTQVTAGAPDFWVGTAGVISGHSSPDINSPGSAWDTFPQNSGSEGGVAARIRSGYQIASKPGTMTYKGSISGSGLIWGSIAVAYTTSVPTPGTAPVIGPGGGGGGGLGANNGGAGMDGQLILTWTGASGAGYGTPPSPQPYASWSPTTTVGTTSADDVDINGPAGITDVVNYLASPPVFRIADLSAPSVPSGTLTPVSFTGDSATVDTYAGWSSGSYRVQRSGIYLFHGLGCFAANTAGTRQVGVTVNGTTYWGPGYAAASAGATHATKTVILSLVAGDTVSLAVRQDSGSALTLSATSATRFFLTWLCNAGPPQGNWVPPDTTYRWVSGTSPAELPGLFQNHLANDLGFLVNRPYLLAYQSVGQSGLPVGSFSTVTMDSVSGIVHGDNGDPWSGWTPGAGNLYTAPVDGWWLTVAEYLTGPSSSAGATVTAGIQPSTSGGVTPAYPVDWWQANVATPSASVGGGATAVGLSYALAGETLTPAVMGSGFPSPYPTLTGQQNSGVAASSFAAVWISN